MNTPAHLFVTQASGCLDSCSGKEYVNTGSRALGGDGRGPWQYYRDRLARNVPASIVQQAASESVLSAVLSDAKANELSARPDLKWNAVGGGDHNHARQQDRGTDQRRGGRRTQPV